MTKPIEIKDSTQASSLTTLKPPIKNNSSVTNQAHKIAQNLEESNSNFRRKRSLTTSTPNNSKPQQVFSKSAQQLSPTSSETIQTLSRATSKKTNPALNLSSTPPTKSTMARLPLKTLSAATGKTVKEETLKRKNTLLSHFNLVETQKETKLEKTATSEKKLMIQRYSIKDGKDYVQTLEISKEFGSEFSEKAAIYYVGTLFCGDFLRKGNELEVAKRLVALYYENARSPAEKSAVIKSLKDLSLFCVAWENIAKFKGELERKKRNDWSAQFEKVLCELALMDLGAEIICQYVANFPYTSKYAEDLVIHIFQTLQLSKGFSRMLPQYIAIDLKEDETVMIPKESLTSRLCSYKGFLLLKTNFFSIYEALKNVISSKNHIDSSKDRLLVMMNYFMKNTLKISEEVKAMFEMRKELISTKYKDNQRQCQQKISLSKIEFMLALIEKSLREFEWSKEEGIMLKKFFLFLEAVAKQKYFPENNEMQIYNPLVSKFNEQFQEILTRI